MPAKLKEPTDKVTITLFAGDKDKLAALYPTVGYNAAIRQLVRTHLRKVEERVNQQVSTAELTIEHHE